MRFPVVFHNPEVLGQWESYLYVGYIVQNFIWLKYKLILIPVKIKLCK